MQPNRPNLTKCGIVITSDPLEIISSRQWPLNLHRSTFNMFPEVMAVSKHPPALGAWEHYDLELLI